MKLSGDEQRCGAISGPALKALLQMPLAAGTKGLPNDGAGVLLGDVSTKQWNLLQEQLPVPCAVIRRSALKHNLEWMRNFIQEENVLIAPHGKTTMAPQLFDWQLAAGAWGITVATVQQLKVCRHFGVQRILLANQLVGAEDVCYLARELAADSAFEFYCIVDSVAGAERLQRLLQQSEEDTVLRVLLEIGVKGGRSGCRTMEHALAVAQHITTQPRLALHGVECYEGIIASGDTQGDERRVRELLALVAGVYQRCVSLRLFSNPREVLLSAGGSAYFDVVAPILGQTDRKSVKAILRSGCYLTHDNAFYERHFQNILVRTDKQHIKNGLRAALEVWAYVQSLPEPGLAILTVGKRDISHDIDLPVVTKWFRPRQMEKPHKAESDMEIVALNDQHAYLNFSGKTDLKVGDMMGLGISHPCTTFDKWQLLWLVDDDYTVIEGIRTFF